MDIESRIMPLKYIKHEDFSHIKQRVLFSRWHSTMNAFKDVIKYTKSKTNNERSEVSSSSTSEDENAAAGDSDSLNGNYHSILVPHLKKKLINKTRAIDVLSLKMKTLYLYLTRWQLNREEMEGLS